MNFNQELQQKVIAIEAILKNFIPKEEGYQKTVMDAMNYSLLAGGKRLRPLLMAETYQLFGGQDRAILEPFMAAIEMIHTYSLVHDDLPAMDNDEYRRGRKTTHVVYGEAMAILAGDGLLNYSFETALKAFDTISSADSAVELTSYQKVAKAMKVLSAKAGIYGMIGGQVIDMEEYDGVVNRSRLDLMYQLKTGALIEASMMIGAIMAGAKDDEIYKIEHIASDVGLAFQIKDDILDITSTPEVLGKPVHSDEKNEKTTYVTIMNLDQALNEVVLISTRAMNAFEALPYENKFLENLIRMLINREN
ncbi:MAG: polyprenyl synthetase family protein [Mobilitalea sp.]